MALPQEAAQFLASIATGLAAALAAAMLARPDRSSAWALLPVAPLVLWLGGLGWGCFADLGRMGPAGAGGMGTSWGCLKFILLLGTPLTAALFLLLRHAGPVRPLPVLLLGGLASAALCSAGLSLFHHLDAMLMILVWHGGAVAVLVVLGWALAGRCCCGRPPPLARIGRRYSAPSRVHQTGRVTKDSRVPIPTMRVTKGGLSPCWMAMIDAPICGAIAASNSMTCSVSPACPSTPT